MKSTGRRVVVGIAIGLIMGLGWYEMRLAKPRTGCRCWAADRACGVMLPHGTHQEDLSGVSTDDGAARVSTRSALASCIHTYAMIYQIGGP